MSTTTRSTYTNCIYILGGCWLGHMIGAWVWPEKVGHTACLLTGGFALALSLFRLWLGPRETGQ